MAPLADFLGRWRQWSETADRSEDGWESDFPDWGRLIDAGREALLDRGLTADEIRVLAECFALAQEGEELLAFAVNNVHACWPVLQALATEPIPGCRWQVYAAAGETTGSAAEGVLRAGLSDPDGYARRRALLALARLRPGDAEALAERFLGSPDPYIRQAALDMVAVASIPFQRRMLTEVLADPSTNVRDAAAEMLARLPG